MKLVKKFTFTVIFFTIAAVMGSHLYERIRDTDWGDAVVQDTRSLRR